MDSRERRIKDLISREYKIYREEERQGSLPRTLYEKACNASARIIAIRPGKKAQAALQQAIDFAHLKTTPEGVTSFTFLFLLVTTIPAAVLTALGIAGLPGLPLGYGFLVILLSLFFTFYLHLYPRHLKKVYEMSAGSDIVTMILYMAMFMRNAPALEGAVRFAAENIRGELGYELKKLLWDVEVGNYLSMEAALLDYTKKWQKNRPFIESVQLIITSTRQAGPRREELLEEAVNTILEGNREQARSFNQKLKLPVMIIHALGIILPVMGLVFFPIVSIFLKLEAALLFVGYDVILPLVLYFVITMVMEIRPATFSKIDVSDNPDMPPKGKFRHGSRLMSARVVGVAVAAAIISAGILLYFAELASVEDVRDFEGILPGIVITGGIAAGFAAYYILLSKPRLKIRQETRQIEGEFAEALFQMGSQIYGGVPVELAVEQSMDRIRNLKIKDLFAKALKNMKMLGLTFQQAFFDEKYGATRFYPSRIVKSVMKTVVESSKKGVKVASAAMLSVSRYLKGLHATQEEVKESLNDTLTSLKFQAYFLTPMISGVVGTLAIIIIQILRNLAVQAPATGASVGFLENLQNISITPFQFILIVAVYMIETSFILSMFINAIENGDDEIGKQHTTGHTLMIGFLVFAVSMLGTLLIFRPLINTLGT